MTIKTQQVEIWADILDNTSTVSMLHTAMRHVAYNLADMLGRPFKVDHLYLDTIPINCLESPCSNPESEAVGVYLLIDGDLSGEAIMILCPDDAMYVADWLLDARPGTTTSLGEMERSALSELGNLTMSSFLNAIADMVGTPLRVSPPAVAVDTLGVIFEAVAMLAETLNDELPVIKTDFVNEESSLRIQFWVLPDFATSTNPID